MYDANTLTPQMEGRVIKEVTKYNIPGDLIDRRYLYIPVALSETLQGRAEKAGKEPALILDLRQYPFRVPRITYLSSPASNIYRCNPIFNTIMKKLTKSDCLCCSSFICPENWVCSNNLQQIIDEFLKIVEFKQRAVDIYICNKIQPQLLPDGLPIQDYAISQFL
jgi:hypothetical protein